MTQKITKAVFPAAGFGTRFLPVTKAMPKEMLPIVDKPVIQYLVEEAVASGIEEIVIITGRGKRAIEDHFDHSFELEYNLVEKGKEDLLKEVRKLENLAKFVYVRQPKPLGDGHAILCAEQIIAGEPFAVLFGDDIVRGEKPALRQLLDIFEEKQSSVIALERVGYERISSYGAVKPGMIDGRVVSIEGLVEKPRKEDAPSDLGIIGKYVCTPEIFDALRSAKPSRDGEIRLIDGFLELLKTQKIFGVEMEGTRYDTGDKFGLLKATIDFALERPGLGDQLREFLKGKTL